MYALSWSSGGALVEVSALAALIAAENFSSTCLSIEAAMYLLLFGSLLSRPFVRLLLFGFFSRH